MSAKNLLISARDAGGALSVLPVIRCCANDRRFAVTVAASGVAYKILTNLGIDVSLVVSGAFDCIDDANVLMDEADRLIELYNPHAILTGVSGPGAGIDEALIFRAPRSIPTFVIQDYWGDVNLIFGKPADRYFVIDDLAEEITRQKVAGAEISKVGSVKHVAYSQLDPQNFRGHFRSSNAIDQNTFFVCLIGQPLWHLDGYHRTMRAALDEIKNIPWATVLYLPHPAERDGQNFPDWLPIAQTPNDVLEVIVDCDALCAVNSSVIADAAAYAHAIGKMHAIGIYMLWDDEILKWIKSTTGMDFVPLGKVGCAMTLDHQTELLSSLNIVGNAAERKTIFSAITKNKLYSPDAAMCVVEHIWSDLMN